MVASQKCSYFSLISFFRQKQEIFWSRSLLSVNLSTLFDSFDPKDKEFQNDATADTG